MKNRKNIMYVGLSAVLLAGVFVGGIYVGYAHRPYIDKVSGISNTQNITSTSADFEPFWKVWNMIDEKFPGAKDVSPQDRVYGAIKGLVSSLDDPYSVYFPPQDSKDFQDTINGSFVGIGMEIGMKNKVLTVIAPLKNTPAAKAGIRAGDFILKIDDTSTSDMSVDQAVHFIRGKKGVPVKLSIFREGDKEPRDITVVRDVIEIPLIDTKKRDDGVFVISLYNFGGSSTSDFTKAIQEYKNTGYNKLIIDLRNDPGGYLDSAVDIASMFLPQGDVVVTEHFGSGIEDHVYRSKGYGFVDPSKNKIAILVDRGSASASEIVSGALQQHNVAKLIGEKTYGKGSVQEVMDVTGNTTLKLTIAKWLTPNGTSISKKGLDPDIPVNIDSKALDAGKDPVMDRALEYFKNGK